MDSEGDTVSSSEETEGSVVVDMPSAFQTTTPPTSRGDRFESRSKRNCWLPFPPGPLSPPKGERSFQLKNSKVAVDPSPDRVRTYEIQVKNLFYKLPPRRRSKFEGIRNFIQRLRCGPPKADALPQDKPDRYILRNINFEAKPGELLAVAGPSGAGKSTLLEVLAGRVRPTSPPGCVLVNDQVVNVHQFQRVSGYVMQDDALFPCLTVMETLLFSARLRLPATIPYAEKLARVKTVMAELGLQHAANTRIGDELNRGVSGGERRRVSIGVDVIHNPAVLFLDEPTSGLDSAAAVNIVEMLKVMAESHSRTVILSIHQPSVRLLQLMHSVLLLADGMVVHHGSLELLAMRLEAQGHEIPPQVNVLEYAMDAINSKEADAIKAQHATGVKLPKLKDFLNANEDSSAKACDDLEYQEYLKRAWGSEDDRGPEKVTYANSSFEEVVVLAQRFFKNILRPKELFTARAVQALCAGVALGTIFLKVEKDKAGAKERLGFLAFTLTFFLSGTTEGLPIFLQERHILMRETSRGAYRVSSYVLSNQIIFAPFLLVMGLMYSIPVYWLVYLYPTASAFLFFCLVLWLVLLMANAFVSFFAAISPNFIMGNSLISACMGAFFLFSGFFISKDKIPDYWIWMHYISLFKYPFDALLINEYENRLDTCFVPVDPTTGFCSWTGKQVLRDAGVDHMQKWMDVGIMVGFVLAYRVLSYFLISWRLSRRRR
ncbi:hypothetical protein Mapa_004007 [Marchantia paleacea]|nr:hypothetical protein Mapa_004007 [Marchantia paleacea]